MLSAGLNRSGIDLMRMYGTRVALTDVDASRLEIASEFVIVLGISHMVECQQVDMFKIASGLGPDAKCETIIYCVHIYNK